MCCTCTPERVTRRGPAAGVPVPRPQRFARCSALGCGPAIRRIGRWIAPRARRLLSSDGSRPAGSASSTVPRAATPPRCCMVCAPAGPWMVRGARRTDASRTRRWHARQCQVQWPTPRRAPLVWLLLRGFMRRPCSAARRDAGSAPPFAGAAWMEVDPLGMRCRSPRPHRRWRVLSAGAGPASLANTAEQRRAGVDAPSAADAVA